MKQACLQIIADISKGNRHEEKSYATKERSDFRMTVQEGESAKHEAIRQLIQSTE